MSHRVVITGLGVVTPAAIGAEAFWQAILAGASAIKPISRFDAGEFPCRIGGQIDDFSARNYVPKDYRKAVKVMARDIEIAVAAADLAFKDSGLVTRANGPDAAPTIDPKRLGCNIGAGLIFTDLDELGSAVSTAVSDGKFDFAAWGSSGMGNLTPLWLLKYLPNMLSCHVTIIHGCEGPSNCITCGDASGLLSVGEAARLIARGDATAAIAGGAETKLNPMGLLRQGLMNRLCCARNESPQTACRPFDKEHGGAVIGEGGGLIVLEELDHAKARGARIYAELAGFGGACDPNGIDVTKPTAGCLDLAVKRAIAQANITPGELGMIVAHGTAVPGEDACETAAWRAALGAAAASVPAVSFTGATGSMFAGSGGVSLALAAYALKNQVVPPTANFAAPAAGCELNFAALPRQAKLDYTACGSFGVGGQSSACVLKKFNG